MPDKCQACEIPMNVLTWVGGYKLCRTCSSPDVYRAAIQSIKDRQLDKFTVRLHVPDLPEELHRAVKSTAAAQGKSLKDFVIEALQEKLSK